MMVFSTERQKINELSETLRNELDRLVEQFHAQLNDALQGISDVEAVSYRRPGDPSGDDDEERRMSAARATGMGYARGRLYDAQQTVVELTSSPVLENVRRRLDALRGDAWVPVEETAAPSGEQPSGDAAAQPSGDAAAQPAQP